jgi:uncharacterized delta-60 repeat protein
MTRLCVWTTFGLAAVAFGMVSPAARSAGSLDPTFHTRAGSSSLLSGKIVGGGPRGTAMLTGDQGVTRIGRDDRIDRTFGSNGTVIANVPPLSIARAVYNRVAVNSRGDVFMATSWFRYVPLQWEMSVLRLRPDGSVETAFGNGGRYLRTGVWAAGITAAPDGGVLLALEIGPFSGAAHAGLLKLDADGRPDSSFGTDGLIEPAAGPFAELPHVSYSGGDVVATGTAQNLALLARFTPTGRAATGFGETGVRAIGPGSPRALLPRPGGKVVVAGSGDYPGTFAAWRFLADGRPDPTFGGGHRFYRTLGIAEDVVVQRDGKLVLAVERTLGMTAATLVRLLRDGRRDTTFHGAPAPDPDDDPSSLGGTLSGLVQRADGRLTGSGSYEIESRYDFGSFALLFRWLAGDASVSVRAGPVATRGKAVRLPLRCRAPHGSRCRGVLRLSAKVGNKRVAIGGRSLSLAPGRTVRRAVALTPRARTILRTQTDRLTVLAETTIRDRIGYVDIRRAVLLLVAR